MEHGSDNVQDEVGSAEVDSPKAEVRSDENGIEKPVPVAEEVKAEPEQDVQKHRSVGEWVKLVASRVLLVFSIIIVIFTVISSFTFNKDDRQIFGVKMFVVLSDSMSKTDFSAGDLIFVKDVDFESLKEGDIISFTSLNDGSRGETVTHKIREKTTVDGQTAYITYGTTTDTNDETAVTKDFFKGKYVGRVPYVGYVFNFIKSVPGYIVCILLPFALLIGYQGWNCIKAFRAYRGEQTDDLRTERVSLQKEREENQKLLEEMRALREEIAQRQAKNGEAQKDDAPPPNDAT